MSWKMLIGQAITIVCLLPFPWFFTNPLYSTVKLDPAWSCSSYLRSRISLWKTEYPLPFGTLQFIFLTLAIPKEGAIAYLMLLPFAKHLAKPLMSHLCLSLKTLPLNLMVCYLSLYPILAGNGGKIRRCKWHTESFISPHYFLPVHATFLLN